MAELNFKDANGTFAYLILMRLLPYKCHSFNKKLRRATVKYANEVTTERDIVWCIEVVICGRKGVFEAVIEPNKTYALLGAIVMETLDLIVKSRALKIYPNPRAELPMAEIE